MRTKTLLTTAFALGLLAAAPGAFAAEAADPRADDRKALLAVFHEMEAGINAQDVEQMIAQMAPEATVTWLNGEVSRGHDQIRAYYHRMVKGDDRILDRYTTAAKLGASARFYGDVAVADGTMQDAFVPVARGPFELSSNWTSTSAKIGGRWKVVSMHLSSNVFTNSLIEEAKDAALHAGIGGALGGILVGWLLGRARKRVMPN
jgi:uncharacterized protein (TIGR02246 family)